MLENLPENYVVNSNKVTDVWYDSLTKIAGANPHLVLTVASGNNIDGNALICSGSIQAYDNVAISAFLESFRHRGAINVDTNNTRFLCMAFLREVREHTIETSMLDFKLHVKLEDSPTYSLTVAGFEHIVNYFNKRPLTAAYITIGYNVSGTRDVSAHAVPN